MSVCTFIASDNPLPTRAPGKEYPIAIDIDSGTIYDGGADDNFFLHHFEDVQSYADKKYGVWLEWNYTDGRAKQIIEYVKTALRKSDAVELWHIWLAGYCEFEDRPYIHRKEISIDELSAEGIKKIDNAEIWNKPDKRYPERPSFYCLTIKR